MTLVQMKMTADKVKNSSTKTNGTQQNSDNSYSKVSYFEFVLDPDLLEQHLSNGNKEPDAVSLISLLLHQADEAVKSAALKHSKDLGAQEAHPKNTSRVLTLKVLALQTASYLKWDLEVLKSASKWRIYSLLCELVACVTGDGSADNIFEKTMEYDAQKISDLSETELFAISLLHRWCIDYTIEESFPNRPAKISMVSIPGLVDTSGSSNGRLDVVRERVDDSANFLKKICQLERNIARYPVLKCFNRVFEENKNIVHNWDGGEAVAWSDIQSQICYALGMHAFRQEDYTKSYDQFNMSYALRDVRSYCAVDIERLNGYLTACAALVRKPQPAGITCMLTTVELFRRTKPQNIVSLFQQDNLSHELLLSYRESLVEEMSTLPQKRPLLLSHLEICNVVRRIHDGAIIFSGFISHLVKKSTPELNFLAQVIEETLATTNAIWKENTLTFARYLCMTLPPTHSFSQRICRSLSPSDLQLIESSHDVVSPCGAAILSRQSSLVTDMLQEVRLGELEHRLMQTVDVNVIREIVVHLMKHRTLKSQIVELSEKWQLRPEIEKNLDAIQPSLAPVLAHVLIAKALLCFEQRKILTAQNLYAAADATIKDHSFMVSRLIRHEMLLVDLELDVMLPDLAGRIVNALSCLSMEKDVQPSQGLIIKSLAWLFNHKEYSTILQFPPEISVGMIYLCQILSALLKDLPMLRAARTPAQDLFDAFVQIFTQGDSVQPPPNTPRDIRLQMTLPDTLNEFLDHLKEPTILSIMISLFARLYSLMKTEVTSDIATDYNTIWPPKLRSPLTAPVLIGQSLTKLLKLALTVEPRQTSWLRTQGDLYFAHSQYAKAMRNYLEMGAVTSVFFTKPITKNVFDDQVLRNLIKCCSYLDYHTQAAIVCQMLPEVDYTTAFSELQEKVQCDATDSYYRYIWEVTILEFLIHIHDVKHFGTKKRQCLRLIAQPELNANNPPDILYEAERIRKKSFLQLMMQTHLVN